MTTITVWYLNIHRFFHPICTRVSFDLICINFAFWFLFEFPLFLELFEVDYKNSSFLVSGNLVTGEENLIYFYRLSKIIFI